MGIAVAPGGSRSARRPRCWDFRNVPAVGAEGRAAGQARRLLPAAQPPRHRRHRHPRDGLRRGRAVVRQHPLLVPVHARRRAQLRPALAAALHLRARARGPLPPERPRVVDGAPRYVTALGESDDAGGWRENKATGGILIDVEAARSCGRPVDAALAALVRRAASGCSSPARARSRSPTSTPAGRDGRRAPRLHPRPRFRGRPRVRRPVAGPRDRHLRRPAPDRSASTSASAASGRSNPQTARSSASCVSRSSFRRYSTSRCCRAALSEIAEEGSDAATNSFILPDAVTNKPVGTFAAAAARLAIWRAASSRSGGAPGWRWSRWASRCS